MSTIDKNIQASSSSPDPALPPAPTTPAMQQESTPGITFDLERMKKALASPRYTIPSGMTAQEIGEYIDSIARRHSLESEKEKLYPTTPSDSV